MRQTFRLTGLQKEKANLIKSRSFSNRIQGVQKIYLVASLRLHHVSHMQLKYEIVYMHALFVYWTCRPVANAHNSTVNQFRHLSTRQSIHPDSIICPPVIGIIMVLFMLQ